MIRSCPLAAGLVMPGADTVHVARPRAADVEDQVPVKKLLVSVRSTEVVIEVLEVFV